MMLRGGPPTNVNQREEKRLLPVTSIGVAMTTYNGARFIGEQLDSLARQELLPRELHVGDDGSSDGTLEIIADFARTAPFPVHVRRNPDNLGYGENFIQTALRCSSPWIAFCDQDDVWLPQKLARSAAAIAAGPADLRLVAHDVIVADEALRPRGPFYFYPPRPALPRLTLDPEWFCLGFSQVFDKRLLTDIPPRPRVDIGWHREKQSHDVWIALLANATGSVMLLDEPLAFYRSHGGNVTLTDVRPGLRERLAAALESHGSLYQKRARHLHSVATLLREKAAASPPDLASALEDSAARIRDQSERLAARGAVHCAPRLSERVSAYRGLRRGGAYSRTGSWHFGRTAAIKDLLYALIPLTGRR